MNFIEWCNQNTGFVGILLSAFTLLVSIIAIMVSIHTARLPYKKKLLVICGSYISSDGTGFHITVTNIGNRGIYIKTIGFKIKKLIYINKNTLFESQVILGGGETTSQYFAQEEIINLIKQNQKGNMTPIWAFVEDSEGKRYKKKLTNVGKILWFEWR